jgi:methionyl-tRNA formyltransferase
MINNNKFFIEKLTNIIFFGYSEKFKELTNINNKYKINTFIITGSDQIKFAKNDVKVFLYNKLNINFKNFIKKKFDINKTLFISLGARYIFNSEMINFFQNNLVNFHGSRLPLDAGGGGFSWRIMREDRIDSQLVHLINESVDQGPIIDSEISLFPKSCKIPHDLEEFRLKKFLNFYEKFIIKIIGNYKFSLKIQLNYLGRYNPRLHTIKDGIIDWNMNSYDLINFIDAFDEPYRGATTYLNNQKLGKLHIKSAQLHGGDSSNHPYMSGVVSRHDKKWIVVSTTGKHMLLIEKVIDKNGNNILSKIKVGDRFYNKLIDIEKGKSFRTKYNSKGLMKKF